MLQRLVDNWVYGSFLAGLLLVALTPVLAQDWPLSVTLVFLTLPIYMLHQYEEHDADRFHRAINHMLGKGQDVLPSGAIFIVNIPMVWGINATAFALTTTDPGWGLIALYLLIANALVHIGQAMSTRAYNPGLATAALLFLPLGLAGTVAITSSAPVSPIQHVVAVGIAVGVHIAIQAYVFFNFRNLRDKSVPQ